jgi:hypothetical protein
MSDQPDNELNQHKTGIEYRICSRQRSPLLNELPVIGRLVSRPSDGLSGVTVTPSLPPLGGGGGGGGGVGVGGGWEV